MKTFETYRREQFVAEILAICRKYNLAISHEDHQGAFEFPDFEERYAEWLTEALQWKRWESGCSSQRLPNIAMQSGKQ